MSDEELAVVYALIDELLRELDGVIRYCLEVYITTGAAIDNQRIIREKIHELRAELEETPPHGT